MVSSCRHLHGNYILSKFRRQTFNSPPSLFNLFSHGSMVRVSLPVVKPLARPVSTDRKLHMDRLTRPVQMVIRLLCDHDRHRQASHGPTASQCHLLPLSISHKYPPAQQRAKACLILNKTAAPLVFPIHLGHHSTRRYHTPKASPAPTHLPVSQARLLNTHPQIPLVPPMAYRHITTSTARTPPFHPAPLTDLRSLQQSTAPRLLYQRKCPPPHPHPCASRPRHPRCQRRSFRTQSLRHRSMMV